jgi:cytochrome bd ubiquinol oxidase subunit II
MTLPDACAALIVVGLTAYAALGGADFGAGFWDLTAGGPERGARVRGLVQRSMAPVWEANHVWLIFVLVVFWTAFPGAFGAVMSALYVPLFLAAVGIILRGTTYAVRGEATTVAEGRVLGGTFALSSVLTPFFLGAAIGAVASGSVPAAGGSGAPFAAWLTPTALIAGGLAVVTGVHLAAVYMAGDAARLGLEDLCRGFRARALGAGAAAGALAIGGLTVVHADAPALYEGLTSGGGLACVVVSAAAGVATLALVRAGRFEAARFCAVVAVAGITVGWGVAQHPALLPGRLTVAQAAAPDATLVALLASIGVGLLIVGPCLAALYGMALTGRLAAPFRPLGARLRPEPTREPGPPSP